MYKSCPLRASKNKTLLQLYSSANSFSSERRDLESNLASFRLWGSIEAISFNKWRCLIAIQFVRVECAKAEVGGLVVWQEKERRLPVCDTTRRQNQDPLLVFFWASRRGILLLSSALGKRLVNGSHCESIGRRRNLGEYTFKPGKTLRPTAAAKFFGRSKTFSVR